MKGISIHNFCWEFCYELILADPKGDSQPTLIMNLPMQFSNIVENRLMSSGFFCASIIPHGSKSVIMQFRKIKSEVAS